MRLILVILLFSVVGTPIILIRHHHHHYHHHHHHHYHHLHLEEQQLEKTDPNQLPTVTTDVTKGLADGEVGDSTTTCPTFLNENFRAFVAFLVGVLVGMIIMGAAQVIYNLITKLKDFPNQAKAANLAPSENQDLNQKVVFIRGGSMTEGLQASDV